MGVSEMIPADDILLLYGPADDQKKRAVTHLLDPKCGQFITLSEMNKDARGTDSRNYWIVANVEPVDTVPLVGMLLEKYHSTYGDDWLRAVMWGVLRSLPDRNIALEIAEYVHKMVEKDSR